MSLQVYLAALRKAAGQWDDAAGDLRGAMKSLADIDTALLGPRASSAATTFLDTWSDELKRLRTAAAAHSDTLVENATLFAAADEDAVARCQKLLSWTDRAVSPEDGFR